MGATAEHLVPLAFGGEALPDLQELGVAHRSCNSTGGNYVKQALARRGVGPVAGHRRPSPVLMSESVDDELAGSGLFMSVADFGVVPVGHNAPRLFSAPHPDAVGSHGPEAIGWINERRHVPLRWSQELVLLRALEVDGLGDYCWDDVLVTQPRRGGKTVLLGELACWRAHQGDRFGEVQQVAHVAKDLTLARMCQSEFWSWSVDRGYSAPRKSNGQEVMFASDRGQDGGRWQIYSHGAGIGHGSGLRLIDEVAFLKPEVKEVTLDPTGIGRPGSQTWLFGMALDRCTVLGPELRARAGVAGSNVMLAEWSAAPGADVDDLDVWLGVMPYRDRFVDRAVGKAFRERPRGFREQYLNQWPAVASQGGGCPGGWSGGGLVQGVPPLGGVAAVSGSRDRSSFVAVVACGVGGGVGVWCWRAGSLSELGAVLSGWGPSRVLMGPGLVDEQDFGLVVDRVSAAGSVASVSELERQVRGGGVSHEHVAWVDEQVDGAVLSESERGRVLSERLSSGPVEVVRALGWAVWGLSLPAAVEEAAIW